MDTNNKKSFDPTVSFTFFGSWLKAMEAIETEQDSKSNVYVLFKAIASYSMYDETPNFSNFPVLNALWPLIEREIDLSIGKRKIRFANDEINENYQKIIKALTEYPEMSYREIGEMTGTSKDMVSRVKRKYQRDIDNAVACFGVNDRDNDKDIDSICVGDIGGAGDTDSMRRDTRQTVRQYEGIQAQKTGNNLCFFLDPAEEKTYEMECLADADFGEDDYRYIVTEGEEPF